MSIESLNPAQRAAASHDGPEPLLIIAGAGSGKTNTLAHRVAHLLHAGVAPERILLLTFSRRAAAEMTRRAQRIVAGMPRGQGARGDLRWSGTFHAIANRLLRLYAASVGLDPAFTVLDRSDASDLMNMLRSELGLARTARRFPKKATCLAIYSRAVSAQCPIEDALAAAFPWCEEWADELRTLFRAYVEAKVRRQVLDYDDLLLYWFHLMSEPALAAEVAGRFDQVLVDEYQDTSALQAAILQALKPTGAGLTVVGDDAQSIYSFRAATIHNILAFPHQYPTPARVVVLEENYRSTQPILAAANAVIAASPQRHAKTLFSRKPSPQKPILVTAADEIAQVDYVVRRVLEAREAGVELRRQAVLFRTAHHADALEIELGRRNIPYVKFGGLKFLESAHVKDLICILRWAENPADSIAAFRVLQLLPGIGPASARQILERVEAAGGSLEALAAIEPPTPARPLWPPLCELLARLADPATAWAGQVGMVRRLYEPLLPELYDAPHVRAGDLDQLEQIAGDYPGRARFLAELTLDPPAGSGDLAGPPQLDEDYLILSTIHSAKGQEWDEVHVLSCADGCIPSDMATGDVDQIEEERRLLYVAMTRARTALHLVHPLRMFIRQQHRHGGRHVLTPLSRFLSDEVLDCFERQTHGCGASADQPARNATARVDVAARLRQMW